MQVFHWCDGWRARRVSAFLMLLVSTGCATPTPQSTQPRAEPSRTTSAPADAGALYHAAITVAEASLRLHETDRAKEWLARAPAAERGWEWRYLTASSDRSAAAISLDGGAVADLTVSPDGRLLAVAMADGHTHLLDTSSGDVVRTLDGHTAAAWTPVFTRDGQRHRLEP